MGGVRSKTVMAFKKRSLLAEMTVNCWEHVWTAGRDPAMIPGEDKSRMPRIGIHEKDLFVDIPFHH